MKRYPFPQLEFEHSPGGVLQAPAVQTIVADVEVLQAALLDAGVDEGVEGAEALANAIDP